MKQLKSGTNAVELIKELRTPTYGHGAFGERERYDPSSRDLYTAAVLENLVLKNEVLALENELLRQQADLGIADDRDMIAQITGYAMKYREAYEQLVDMIEKGIIPKNLS